MDFCGHWLGWDVRVQEHRMTVAFSSFGIRSAAYGQKGFWASDLSQRRPPRLSGTRDRARAPRRARIRIRTLVGIRIGFGSGSGPAWGREFEQRVNRFPEPRSRPRPHTGPEPGGTAYDNGGHRRSRLKSARGCWRGMYTVFRRPGRFDQDAQGTGRWRRLRPSPRRNARMNWSPQGW
jgi:hypothetical protein